MVIVVCDEVLQEDLQVRLGGGHALDYAVGGVLIRLEHVDHGNVFRAGGIRPNASGKIEHGNQRQEDAHNLRVRLHGLDYNAGDGSSSRNQKLDNVTAVPCWIISILARTRGFSGNWMPREELRLVAAPSRVS